MPIVAIGGAVDDELLDYVLGLGRSRDVLLIPTAAMEEPSRTIAWYERLRTHGAMTSHVHFFPWPPVDLRARVLEAGVVLVPGGNTANMLAVWRLHGVDVILREAWENGALLTGWSAGAICWFECGVTDSFGPDLAPLDCLGFLSGSACPHYDGEALRRPRYRELVAAGFPAGVAIDDNVGVRFDGTDLVEVVTSRQGATAYEVSASGDAALDARVL